MARKSDRFGERGSRPLRAKDDDDKVSVLISKGGKKMSEDYLLSKILQNEFLARIKK